MFSVFIDASKKGWGGVVNDTTAEVVVMGDSWDAQVGELHINILEGLAFRNTVNQMSPELDGRTVAVWIDNTSVVGVSRKGMSIRSQDECSGHWCRGGRLHSRSDMFDRS